MKKLILGMVIGLMLGLSTNAFAAIGDIVSAKFASFNYVVNGSTKAIDSPVLVYEGTSYLRTTDLGNLLGFDVTYRADSRTIAFNGPEPVVVTPAPQATPDPVTGEIPEVSADPNATPDPNASPTPTPSPTPSLEPTPTPWVGLTPAQRAFCDQNRQDVVIWDLYGCY